MYFSPLSLNGSRRQWTWIVRSRAPRLMTIRAKQWLTEVILWRDCPATEQVNGAQWNHSHIRPHKCCSKRRHHGTELRSDNKRTNQLMSHHLHWRHEIRVAFKHKHMVYHCHREMLLYVVHTVIVSSQWKLGVLNVNAPRKLSINCKYVYQIGLWKRKKSKTMFKQVDKPDTLPSGACSVVSQSNHPSHLLIKFRWILELTVLVEIWHLSSSWNQSTPRNYTVLWAPSDYLTQPPSTLS